MVILLFSAVAWALAAMFVFAVRSHLEDPRRLRSAMKAVAAPPWIAPWTAGIEAGLIPLLVLAPSFGGWGAAAYLGSITAVIGGAVFHKVHIEDCGCFKRRQPVNAAFFVRNGVLITLSVLVGLFASGLAGTVALAPAAATALVVGGVFARRSRRTVAVSA